MPSLIAWVLLTATAGSVLAWQPVAPGWGTSRARQTVGLVPLISTGPSIYSFPYSAVPAAPDHWQSKQREARSGAGALLCSGAGSKTEGGDSSRGATRSGGQGATRYTGLGFRVVKVRAASVFYHIRDGSNNQMSLYPKHVNTCWLITCVGEFASVSRILRVDRPIRLCRYNSALVRFFMHNTLACRVLFTE